MIPAYNEEKYLPRLLDSVALAANHYRGGAAAIEIIVADNRSTDGTARIATDRGCRVVPVERRRIASVRNGGATAAKGEILCFVDADFRIHPQTFNVIEDLLASGRYVGGATGTWLERWSVGITLAYAVLMTVAVIIRMDTGVVFCRREDFEAIGGYDESRPVAEDVAFLMALRRLGKKRGQRLACATKAKALASTRKFDEHGDWHYFWLFWNGLPGVIDPSKLQDEFTQYWYKPNR